MPNPTPQEIIAKIDNYINAQGAMNGEARRFGYALRDYLSGWLTEHAQPRKVTYSCGCEASGDLISANCQLHSAGVAQPQAVPTDGERKFDCRWCGEPYAKHNHDEVCPNVSVRYYEPASPCPECGNEERSGISQLLTCESPAMSAREERG